MLRFDSKRMMADLIIAYMAEMKTLTEWLWAQVQQKAPPEVDRARIEKEIKVIGGTILSEISAGGMQALITEWGSGSLADTTSNPAWDEYTRSKYWNPARDTGKHTIRGRPAGEYVDLDDEVRYSTGKWKGRNLEWKYPPQEAQHWLRELMNLSRPTILERLGNVIQTFPMHKYFIDGR